jgi:uncharacterized coiled-coil DUF342 family protein
MTDKFETFRQAHKEWKEATDRFHSEIENHNQAGTLTNQKIGELATELDGYHRRFMEASKPHVGWKSV